MNSFKLTIQTCHQPVSEKEVEIKSKHEDSILQSIFDQNEIMLKTIERRITTLSEGITNQTCEFNAKLGSVNELTRTIQQEHSDSITKITKDVIELKSACGNKTTDEVDEGSRIMVHSISPRSRCGNLIVILNINVVF